MLLIKPEKPDFFFNMPPFDSLLSSENRFGLAKECSVLGIVGFPNRSPAEKLADCRRVGLNILGSGLVCESGGGAGRRNEF